MVTDEQAKENIAANVLRLLDKAGMSQSELGRRAGVSAMAISFICRAVTMTGAGLLARIATVLGVTANDLLLPPPKKYRKGVDAA